MIKLRSNHLLICGLLTSIHFCKHTITCAPVAQQIDTSRSSIIITTSAHNDKLAYANFHADLRMINLATDLTTKVPRKYYFQDCTEKQYLDWYLTKYPIDCQFRFSNATTLKDLLMIYCDPVCGDTYLSYMKKCGKIAMEMAEYYRKLCVNEPLRYY